MAVSGQDAAAPLPRRCRRRGAQDLVDPKIRVDQPDALYVAYFVTDGR
jgi:hypothetical protein